MHALCAGQRDCELNISGSEVLSIPVEALIQALSSYSALDTSSSSTASSSSPSPSSSPLSSPSRFSWPSSSSSHSQFSEQNYLPSSSTSSSSSSTLSLSSSSLSYFSVQSTPQALQDICQTIFSKSNTQYCNTTLLYNGNFANCGKNLGTGIHGNPYTKDGTPKRNLIFEAVCVAEKIQLGEVTKKSYATTEKLVLIVSLLDALSIVIFVLGIAWLRFQIEKEGIAADRDQCTASDYTIACYTMPKITREEKNKINNNESEGIGEEKEPVDIQIKNKLLHHFETVLNENRNLPKNRIENVEGEEIRIADINCSTRCTSYLTAAVERGSAAVVVDKIIAKIRATVSEERVRCSVITLKKPENVNINTLENVPLSVLYALKVALYRFEHFNDKCLALHRIASSNIYSAYITFESEYSYVSCLKQIPNIGVWTRLTQDKKYKLDGQALFITVIQ